MKTDVTAYATLMEALIAVQRYARELMRKIHDLKTGFAWELLFDKDLQEELRKLEEDLRKCAIRATQIRKEMRGELQ